jgi:hypothetical protein
MDDRARNLIAGAVIIGLFALLRLIQLPVAVVFQFVALFGVLFHAQILGKRLFPKAGWTTATAMSVILFFALQSIGQTMWFYANGKLGASSDFWCMLGTMVVCQLVVLILPRKEEEEDPPKQIPWTTQRVILSLLIAACALSSAAYVLIGAARMATLDSIRTPWPLLLPGTLAAIAFAWAAVALSAWLVRSRAITAAHAAIAVGATTGIAPLLYRLGFGFDGFLHVATEKLILASGTLTPKPFYYIGQYVFTAWIARIADIPIDAIDRWLVPVATALLLPLALYLTQEEHDEPLLPFTLFLLPLAPFVATTPQAFAYVLGMSALLLSRGCGSKRVHPLAPLVLAAWSAATHPLAGLPILFVVLAMVLIPNEQTRRVPTLRWIAGWFCAFAAAIVVPLAFYILSRNGATPIVWDLSTVFNAKPWADLGTLFIPWIGNRFVVWSAWATLVTQSLPFLLFIAAVGSVRLLPKQKRGPFIILIASALFLFIAATLLKTAGDFAFLIDYERGNYADRLNLIALFCLLPAALPAVAWTIERARRTPLVSAGLFAACLCIAAAMSYDALPRNDALVVGHGWSVGRADVDAVRAIDRNAGQKPYTVLADQSVSAAAVSQFGFKRYNGDTFYYPIPTGGPLYDIFLRMTYQEPSRDTATEAGKLGASSVVYVVLNDYWWNATNLADSLSAIADNSWTFGDATAELGHSVNVYKFDLSKK